MAFALTTYDAPTAKATTIALVESIAEINAKINELTKEKTDLNARLLKRVKAEGEEDPEGKVRLQAGERGLVIITATNRRLDARLLVKAGVSVKQLEKGTVLTPYEYVSIGKPKAEGAGEDE